MHKKGMVECFLDCSLEDDFCETISMESRIV
jgi:hypothetical protein